MMHPRELSADDVALDLLPEREALGVFDIATVVPVNIAVAVNAGNLGAPVSGTAMAGQGVGVTQL